MRCEAGRGRQDKISQERPGRDIRHVTVAVARATDGIVAGLVVVVIAMAAVVV